MLKICFSKTGKPTLAYNNNFLHSKYDPEKEANRFIKESLHDEHPQVVILLGAGIGYLSSELDKVLPRSKLILVYYSEIIFRHCNERPIISWHPGTNLSFINFLKSNISDIDLEGLKIIEWSPSALLFPLISKKVNSEINLLVKEYRGNIVTTNAFGKTWIRNSFSNFISIDSIMEGQIARPDNPVVITASGPSLENSIEYIKNIRNKINLWSLPSSIPFILGNNIKPDLIILTDSSYYSICHIQEIADQNIPVVMPLSGARGVYNISNMIFLISQPAFYEQIIYRKAGLSPPLIPPKGTVAATALELALELTNKEIIICGLDLCYSDIKSHVRTNSFNNLLKKDANRMEPYYSRIFGRAVMHAPVKCNSIRTSIALNTYSNWFSSINYNNKRIQKRLFRFMPSLCNINGLNNLDTKSFTELIQSYPESNNKIRYKLNENYPDKLIRKNIVLDIIERWKSIINNAEITAKKDINLIVLDSDFLELAYFIDLAGLTSLKKNFRNNKQSVNKSFAKLISKLNIFTGSLYNKIKKANQNA